MYHIISSLLQIVIVRKANIFLDIIPPGELSITTIFQAETGVVRRCLIRADDLGKGVGNRISFAWTGPFALSDCITG